MLWRPLWEQTVQDTEFLWPPLLYLGWGWFFTSLPGAFPQVPGLCLPRCSGDEPLSKRIFPLLPFFICFLPLGQGCLIYALKRNEARSRPRYRISQNTRGFLPYDCSIPGCYFCGEKRKMMGRREGREVLEQVRKEAGAGRSELLPSPTEEPFLLPSGVAEGLTSHSFKCPSWVTKVFCTSCQ